MASVTTLKPTHSAPTTLDGIPDLKISILTSPGDKTDALKLIADSIAQQRQVASKILIFHPYCLSALALCLSLAHILSSSASSSSSITASPDLSTTIVTSSGIILAYLMAIRYFTSPYVHSAEDMDWSSWLGKKDVIVGAKFGDELIGATVMRMGGCKAVIRAWTTKMRYRGRGLGMDMLIESVKVARKTLRCKAEVEFATDHVTSVMVLHSVFNKQFHVRDSRARMTLSRAVSSFDEREKN